MPIFCRAKFHHNVRECAQTKLVQQFRQGTTKPRNAPGPSNTGMALGQQPQVRTITITSVLSSGKC